MVFLSSQNAVISPQEGGFSSRTLRSLVVQGGRASRASWLAKEIPSNLSRCYKRGSMDSEVTSFLHTAASVGGSG